MFLWLPTEHGMVGDTVKRKNSSKVASWHMCKVAHMFYLEEEHLHMFKQHMCIYLCTCVQS